MKTVTDSFALPCSTATFWQTFLDDAYATALYMEGLGFRSFKILDRTATSRRTLCVPKINLPGPLAKLVGDTFAYEEHGTLDPEKGEWTWRMVQPDKPDGKKMISTRGTTRLSTTSSDACRRSDEVVVEANVFGLGGMIESTIEKEVRAGWAKEIAFMKAWLAKKNGAPTG